MTSTKPTPPGTRGRGAHRSRTGPRPDPASQTSIRRGLKWTHLPEAGYQGPIPPFPWAKIHLKHDLDLPPEERERPCERFRERELLAWKKLWRTSQAAAWIKEPYRLEIVAELARFQTRVDHAGESLQVPLIGQLHRLRDQLGLTPAGLKDNGWVIDHPAGEENAGQNTDQVPSPGDEQPVAEPRARLRLLASA